MILFTTGTSRVPLDGFEPPFNLTFGTDMEPGSLPRSHTCFNQLVLPPYKDEAEMRSKLMFAFSQTEGFTLS